MQRTFWELESVSFSASVLRVQVVELTTTGDDPAPPIEILGVVIGGNALRVRPTSRRVSVRFAEILEFRAVPEQISWPTYDDGEEIIPCLLYAKPGRFFDRNAPSATRPTFSATSGLVNVDEFSCYIVHNESFDIYVLAAHRPTFEYMPLEG